MDRGGRHRAIGSLSDEAERWAALARSRSGEYGLTARVPPSLARRLLHRLVRDARRAWREERGELRAMADKRYRPPVGQSVAAYTLVALFRARRVPRLRWWEKLEHVDNSQFLRGVM